MNFLRAARSIALVCLIGLVSVIATGLVPVRASTFEPHAPILIDGNSAFASENGVTSGNGTALDPYVIEGWEISQDGMIECLFAVDCGLSVRNTDAYFVIRNMYVHAATYGIVLSDVRNGEVENSTLVNNGLGGVAVSRSNYVTISSNNITRNGYSFQRYRPSFGLAVYGSTNVVVSGNTVSSNLGSQMTAYGGNFLISQNRFSYTNLVIPQGRFSISSGGAYFEGLNNATISHNQFLAENGIGVSILMSYFTQVTISANVFTSSGVVFEPLPSVFTSADLTMTTDNLIDGRPIYYFKDCSNSSIDGVPVGQLIVVNCSDFQASNLQISHVPVGMVMSNVDEASITGINFSDTGVAFSVYGSNHIRFANNQLVRSGSWWFSWFAHVSNSVITRNSISPTPYGIGITHGQNITVSENYMSDNIGLYLESSSGILVYHNNFLRPATDYQGGQNRWDNDYPSGGNYWASFNGVDTCNGPNQDICMSGDGIGDTPYVVYFGPDRYPLMKPFAPLVTGSVQFAPTSITSQNSGKYLTAKISLPQGFNASNLIRSSIRLNETITATSVRLVTQPSATPLLIVTFSMTQVKELFSKPGIITLQLTVNLLTNTNFRPFQATATVSLVSN